MAMQIGLDELLSMLMARVDGSAMELENQKTRMNIMFRVLWKKGLLTDDDVLEAVRDEHRLLMDLGLLKEMPDDEMLKAAADSMMLWVKTDADAIRASMEEYDKRLKEAMSKQQSKIDVAPAGVLNQLDRLSGGAGGGSGKKLII